jgi:hypothetical protein
MGEVIGELDTSHGIFNQVVVVAQESATTKLSRMILRVFILIKISLSDFSNCFFGSNLVIYAFNSI